MTSIAILNINNFKQLPSDITLYSIAFAHHKPCHISETSINHKIIIQFIILTGLRIKDREISFPYKPNSLQLNLGATRI